MAGRTTDVGSGVTMSWGPAVVPAESRLTVMSPIDAADAVMTKVMGMPWETSSSSDWMVSVGRGERIVLGLKRRQGGIGGPVRPRSGRLAAGGPMMRPAETSSPSV